MAIWHDQYNLFSSLFFMLFQRFITTDVEIGGFFKEGKEEAGKQILGSPKCVGPLGVPRRKRTICTSRPFLHPPGNANGRSRTFQHSKCVAPLEMV
jgi:hypothetical protein